MTPDQLEIILRNVERKQRGWIHGGDVPRVEVLLNGQRVMQVMSIHRKTGRIRVAVQPLRPDKTGKRVMTRTERGAVEARPWPSDSPSRRA